MPAGRPSKYTKKLVEAAWTYVNGGWDDAGDPAPSIEGLCDELEITRPTAYDWAKDESKEFSYILEALMAKQGRKLLAGGLTGEFSAPITKMMLTKHGYSDKIEQDNTSSDGSMTPTVIERTIVKPDAK